MGVRLTRPLKRVSRVEFMSAIDATAQIHPTAIIEPGAIIGPAVVIGPFAVIGPQVVLGRGNVVHSHAVLSGHTSLGDDNTVYQFASVGAPPQDLKFQGEDSRLLIGSRNCIREYVTLQPGTRHGNMETVIGDNNFFMACSHIGHDARVGNKNVFANSCALAGHVSIADQVIVGGLCGIHQFVRVGTLSMLGGGAMVNKDIPPFCIAQGDRAVLAGINKVGLQRQGWDGDQIGAMKRAYRQILRGSGRLRDRLEQARRDFSEWPEIMNFLDFIGQSARGIAPSRRGGLDLD